MCLMDVVLDFKQLEEGKTNSSPIRHIKEKEVGNRDEITRY